LAFLAFSQPGVDDFVAGFFIILGASLGTISNSVTATPALAKCAAIAAPIVPEPMTTAL
jgi:hypothetical protein